MKKTGFASDHAGYTMKKALERHLEEKGYNVTDYGTDSDTSCDYPDFAHPLADAVEKGDYPFGIALCGSGNGIAMTLNKHQGIRAAICWKPELAELARQHNNANVLVIPARFVSEEEAVKIVEAFLSAEFEGGRHQRRIDKIPVKN